MLAERLKSLRNEHQMSQKMLAEKLFVSQQAIAKWENPESKASPNPDALREIANVFGVSTDYLLGKSDVKNPPTSEDMSGLTPKQMKIIEMMEQMTPEQQDEMVRQAEYQLWQRQHQTGGQ